MVILSEVTEKSAINWIGQGKFELYCATLRCYVSNSRVLVIQNYEYSVTFREKGNWVIKTSRERGKLNEKGEEPLC